MASSRGPRSLALLAGLLIVGISLAGFINLKHRPGIYTFRNRTAVPRDRSRPAILSVDGTAIQSTRDLDFILNRKDIGDPVTYELWTGRAVETVNTRLVRYYEAAPAIFLTIGLFSLAIGFLVFVLRPGDAPARLFYWGSLAFGAAVMISGDIYGARGHFFPLLPGVLFDFVYPLAPAILWKFARSFSPHPERPKLASRLIFGLALAIGAALTYMFVRFQAESSLAIYRALYKVFPVFRVYVVVVLLAAMAELVRAFRSPASSETVRSQITWIVFGLAVGLAPFIFLYQIPQIFGGAETELVREDTASAFFIIIPVCIAIAILRHRLLNINLVINKSLVYSLLTVFTVGVYLAAVEILRGAFVRGSRQRDAWTSLGAAVLAAVVFAPGRRKIQILVDRTFFRTSYDYGKAVHAFAAKVQRAIYPEQLLGVFREAVDETLPLERLEFVAGSRALTTLGPTEGGPWAVESSMRTIEGIDFSKRDVLKSLGLDLVLSVPLRPEGLSGYLACGPKKSGSRFSREDLDLLESLAAELASGLQRLRLQEEVADERASRAKAEELVRLKTEFVSTVSHELRTPMSALQSLSELLESGKVRDKVQRERLLHLMAAECGRLSRFLHNVLDFGRIERGAKSYALTEAPLQPVIEAVVTLARSGADSEGLVLKVEMPEKAVIVRMDEDALRQALLNVVDNAIKYSGERKDVTVRLIDRGAEVEVQVEDRGIGIDPEDAARVFDAFFRSERGARHNAKGVGLGLAIVKRIMDAHGGRIGLRSEPGKGTTFSLIFPGKGTP